MYIKEKKEDNINVYHRQCRMIRPAMNARSALLDALLPCNARMNPRCHEKPTRPEQIRED